MQQKTRVKSLGFFFFKLEAIDKFQAESYTFKCLFLRNNSGRNIMNVFKEADWRARDLSMAVAEVTGRTGLKRRAQA